MTKTAKICKRAYLGGIVGGAGGALIGSKVDNGKAGGTVVGGLTGLAGGNLAESFLREYPELITDIPEVLKNFPTIVRRLLRRR